MEPNDGYPGLDEHRAIEFLWATNDGTAIDSWHWLLESSATSFYIKSMNRAMQGAKVTLHGPDARHPGEDHYRFDLIRTHEMEVDPKFVDRSSRAGGRWLTDTRDLPTFFTGRPVADNVDHVVRFCTGHDMFVAGAAPAGGSDWPKKKASMRSLLPIPAEGCVTHVDVFLTYDSDRGPYWPHPETALRAQRAGLGYMTNSLGWKLSVVVFERRSDLDPEPCGDFRGDIPVDRCHRGYVTTVGDDGLLWLCEKLFPGDDEVVEPMSGSCRR